MICLSIWSLDNCGSLCWSSTSNSFLDEGWDMPYFYRNNGSSLVINLILCPFSRITTVVWGLSYICLGSIIYLAIGFCLIMVSSGIHLEKQNIKPFLRWLVTFITFTPLLHYWSMSSQANNYCSPQASQMKMTNDYFSFSVICIGPSITVKTSQWGWCSRTVPTLFLHVQWLKGMLSWAIGT